VEPTTLEDVRWALGTILTRRPQYELYRAYYHGDHRQVFEIASEQYERYFRSLLEQVRENLCKPVVRCFSERLSIEHWEGNAGDDDNAADPGNEVDDTANELWKALRMSRTANRCMTEALELGDSYVLVWPDSMGVNRVWKQRPEEFAALHCTHDPDAFDLAAKLWVCKDQARHGNAPDPVWRLNLYYADRCERYYAPKKDDASGVPKPDAFVEYADDDGPPVIPHQFGVVPVVRFTHDNPNEGSEPGCSVLEDVLPLQDVLNKELADVIIAGEFFALPMRIFTGVQDEVNPATGKSAAEEFNPRRDRNLFFNGEGTKAVQLDPADLRAMAEVTDSVALKIARVTGVPLHYLVLGQGNFPSGEALRTAESRLVSRCTDLQDEWGPQWAAVMGLLGCPEVEPRWQDPAHITEMEKLNMLLLRKQLGVPWEELMEDMGYDEVEIEEMEAEKERSIEMAQSAFSRSFDAGREDARPPAAQAEDAD